ncbi:predicted protein [Uncinocarpus reesii 1704]|uniref:Siderophore biosynthesis n=1 Tax=Uncinocarpus reesii (strain UAMH 1704) TaxID=336963 RepID=C4JLU6_UNCRE|nr:uncharacterized protein UREG_03804 [Uncinocarpus reesii 1704]EEP78958.1 predicted protein [Uncinocarpus reesii 1704]
MKLLESTIPVLMLASTVLAVDCHNRSFTTCDDNIVHWYDVDTGQICDPLDCGGGRAPQRKNVPGCPAYTGTETRATSASYLSCFTPSGASSTIVSMSASASPAETTAHAEPTTAIVTGTRESSAVPPSVTTPAALSTGESGSAEPSATAPISSGSGTTAPPAESTPNAGHFLDSSLAAVAGIAVGVVALI